jgi:hypothetical protein
MPIKTLTTLVLVLLAFLGSTALQASAEPAGIDLLHYKVSDLRTGEESTLQPFLGKPTVLLLFEPGCMYCARQTRILNAMIKECANLQAVALGFNAPRRRMLDYQDDLRPDFPAYMAGADLAYDMGEIVITPVMLLADANGYYQLHLLGLQDRERLESLLNPLGAGC